MATLNETSISDRTRAATESVHRGIERAADALHSTAENAATSAAKLADRAEHGVDTLREKQEKARTGTIDYTVKHPVRSLMISVGVGFVLAKLLRHRSSSTAH